LQTFIVSQFPILLYLFYFAITVLMIVCVSFSPSYLLALCYLQSCCSFCLQLHCITWCLPW